MKHDKLWGALANGKGNLSAHDLKTKNLHKR